jgi:lysophospholipase L1-like esterase
MNTVLDQRAAKTRIGYVGDSIVAGNNLASASLISTLPREIAWARAMYPHFECDVWYDAGDTRSFKGMNAAYSGETVAQTRARLPSPGLYAPQIVIVSAGINSGTTNVTAASIETDLQAICQAYLRAGSRVILANIRPVSAAIIPDGSPQLQVRSDVNAWIASYATTTPDVVLWDVAAAYDDGTGRPKAGYMADGLHPSPLGSQYGALSLLMILKCLVKPIARRMVDDGFNQFPNGRMNGTSGSVGAGVSGLIASNFVAQMVSSGPTTTVSAGLLNNADTGGLIQVFDFTTNGGAASSEIFGFYGASFAPVAGQWVKARVRLSLVAWSGWRSIYFNAGYGDCFSSNSAQSDQLAVGGDFDLETMPFQPASSAIRPYIWIYNDPRVAGSNVRVQIKELEFIQVDDPRYLHNAA